MEEENRKLKKVINKLVTKNNRMEFYGKKHNTDKVTHHRYHESFEMFIGQFYYSTGAMIEIGVDRGSSLAMWLELFKRANIYGVDRDMSFKGDRHEVFKVDQSKKNELEEFKNEMKKKGDVIFFINDDGSHIPEHQLLTFNVLFPLLRNDGIYIIEDVETSYWTKNGLYGYKTRYGLRHKNSIVEIFKGVADIVNDEFIKSGLENSPIKHHNMIKSITFAPNCIIIVKGKRLQRNYRYSKNL